MWANTFERPQQTIPTTSKRGTVCAAVIDQLSRRSFSLAETVGGGLGNSSSPGVMTTNDGG